MREIMKVKEWMGDKMVAEFIQRTTEYLKRPIVNPNTGFINLKFEIKNTDEDYFFPIGNTKSDESVTFKAKQQ